MDTQQRRRIQQNGPETDTLTQHLEMFKRRKQQLRRLGGLTLKKAIDRASDPKIYRKARNHK